MKIFNIKKIGQFSLLLAIAFSFHSVFAQENDIPKDLQSLAQELGCQTKEDCAAAFDSNFEKGLDLAEKYKVYDKEQSEIAKSYKQEVISKLSNITDENFEEEIIKIAKGILSKPKAAKSLQLDKGAVTAAETIVKEVKNAGTNIGVCSRKADTLSREELIDCLEASKQLAKKGDIVEKYIPKGIIEKSEMAGIAALLDEALVRGEYPELGKTAEEAGQKCLRPGSETLKSCDVIAEKYFGPEGVRELAAVRAQTKQIGDNYLKGLENMELATPDGRKIVGKTAIKESCEKAFQTKDIKLAKACGEFAVKNGFADRGEVEESLKFFESVADKNVNFDQCRINPEACQKFIPEQYKKEFEGHKKIYEIIKEQAGFDPMQCERSRIDFEIGKKCFEASKKALPKLKEIAGDFPEVQRMVSEIESGIRRENEQRQNQNEFPAMFQNEGGPGGCKSEKECFAYCNDAAHGAECLSFGAKYEYFDKGEVVDRYQKYNNALNYQNPPFGTGFEGNGRDGFLPDERGYRPAMPLRYQTGPDFRGDTQGPSPECFAAIQSGDFARAKEICSIPNNPYQYGPQNNERPFIAPVRNICPVIPNIACPSGTRRFDKVTPEGCRIYECAPDGKAFPCPAGQSWNGTSCVNYSQPICASGQYWFVPQEGGPGYCKGYPSSSSYSEKENCYKQGGFWTGSYCQFENKNNASSSYSYSSYGYPQTSCSSQLIGLLGAGCHQMYTDSSGISTYCNGEMNKSAKQGDTTAKEGCNFSGNYSSYPSSSSYGSYTGSCSSEMIALLGSGCHYMSTAYFNGEMTQYANPGNTAAKNCSSEYISGCTSGYSSSYSGGGSYSSYSYSSYDPSLACTQAGGAWNGSSCQYGSSSYGGASSSYSSTDPSVSCSQAGGTWSGTYCQMPNTSNYSSASADPSTACAQAGGSWDGSTCVMPSASLNGGGSSLIASIGEAIKGILRIFSR